MPSIACKYLTYIGGTNAIFVAIGTDLQCRRTKQLCARSSSRPVKALMSDSIYAAIANPTTGSIDRVKQWQSIMAMFIMIAYAQRRAALQRLCRHSERI